MKLTAAQLRWLREIRLAGYEVGIIHRPIASLVRLERLGLIERNLATSGERTRWRATAAGECVPLGTYEYAKRSRA